MSLKYWSRVLINTRPGGFCAHDPRRPIWCGVAKPLLDLWKIWLRNIQKYWHTISWAYKSLFHLWSNFEDFEFVLVRLFAGTHLCGIIWLAAGYWQISPPEQEHILPHCWRQGFHRCFQTEEQKVFRQAKLLIELYKKKFPLHRQTRLAKPSSQAANLPGAQPLVKPLETGSKDLG